MTLAARAVGLRYGPTVALATATLTVAPGEVVALVGPSGSGKTTLLYCLSGLVRAGSGTVRIDGTDLADLSADDLVRLRRERFGYVFQGSELVPELSVAENVALPLELLRRPRREVRERTAALLDRLGVADLARRLPDQVSGGQAQRVAVARALVHAPAVVFADEPTGALDSANGATVLDALLGLARDQGSSVVLVTHDAGVAAAADRRVEVSDGVCDDTAPVTPAAAPPVTATAAS
ncbi:ABC transporter ATP-binding protein [Luteimicrobium subarcticum]|uniref:ABC transporter ATP-binding protein n=1 Tax=Luteimicrobium subarcticum TaxID=620910 RepID=UPI001FED0A4D|nr:ABC transporter ATP-binding protein [Luteimicrobium subarcticum]